MNRFLIAFLGVLMLVSCAGGDNHDDMAYLYPTSDVVGLGHTYEGEWIADNKVVSTQQITVERSSDGDDGRFHIRLTLPEKYLAGKILSSAETADKSQSASFSTSETVQSMGYTLQGYSNTSFYTNNMGVSNAYSDKNYSSANYEAWEIPLLGSFSFGVTEDEGAEYRIDLYSTSEQGTAVCDMNTSLWALNILYDKAVVTDLQTGGQRTKEWAQSQSLLYRATKIVK